MKVDLHCHTSISDGTLGIEELLIQAKSNGLDKIAITDHDCIVSSVRGSTVAKRLDGFEVITGVELSSTDTKRNSMAHILCYLPDSPERLEMICRKNTSQRVKAGKVMATKLCNNYPVPAKFIATCAQGSNYISELHIMKALLNCGYTTTIYGDLYDKLFSKDSPDCIAATPLFPTPDEIIEEIHGAGGIAVLAHPGAYDNFELLDELIEKGIIDGVEVWHPRNTTEQQEKLIKIAKKNGLLMTGGSDFHGAFNYEPKKIGDYITPDEHVAALLSYKAKKSRKKKSAK